MDEIYDECSVMFTYASEWVESLSKDDLLSLSITLYPTVPHYGWKFIVQAH